jgi:bifunctional non-homologous end joining protein LigD
MSLREYKRKRDFHRTPEPAGKEKRRARGRQFVIQKHDASRLHYDFRLELDGTLKSWAVPKGPSLDPAVKSLAVHVEDHPLEYASFEGVIPEGEYGGGTVMVWDCGEWEPEGDGDASRDYRSGKLKFRLDGKKLHGSWALVRMGGRAGEGGKNWLLIKHRDDAAKPQGKYDILKKEPLSVVSHRDLQEIADDADSVWSSSNGNGKAKSIANPDSRRGAGKTSRRAKGKISLGRLPGARKSRQPTKFKPQLATLAQAVPAGGEWVHELKFDGYRILAFARNGKVRLISRNGKDWTHRFPTIAAAVAELPWRDAIVDGEVVSLNAAGLSDFQQLQNALKRGDDESLVYYVFDLPHCAGYNLTATPLVRRKEPLEQAVLAAHPRNDGVLRYSDHVTGAGEAVYEKACQTEMEGIICKRADATYEQARSRSWLKVKCGRRQEFVIAGYTKPAGARVGLGALLLGYNRGGKLVYAGRVGTGFTDQSLRELVRTLRTYKTAESPFEKPLTAAQRRGVTWVKPKLVCEVTFTEWTDEGLLRHPSFEGLREDKSPDQITREEAKVVPRAVKAASAIATSDKGAEVAGVTLSHPDRVLYPEMGLTKLDLARYYESVADWILPHLVDRPLTLVRCPGGRKAQCFYQKHLGETMPDAVRGVMIAEKDGNDEYAVIDDLSGLVSLVQIGVLELHPWPARADKVEAPDRLVFDFDPGEGVAWKAIVQAAREARELLSNLGLESFLRTSGGKGLHVVAPLSRRNTWDELKQFAKAVADAMVLAAPDRYIATMSKAKRRGKVFVDYLRNQRGATAIASYSTRAREGAPVAMPLAWDELSERTKSNQYTVLNAQKRLASLAADPWKGFFEVRQSITRSMRQALGAL